MLFRKIAISFAMLLLACASAFAQRNIKAVLQDETTGEAISFATVSLTKDGQDKALKYVLSSDAGEVLLDKVRNGKYTIKAELLGYIAVTQAITVEGKDIDLGVVKMKPDTELLDAAKVSAVGNPIIIKKDTVEYNASSFKTTDNDMLEDLLKKLPGIEVGTDGSVTANGQTITKITIDGKTFFLDDPSLASKNIPAKIINKVKVVEKKSDQAMFTGIDDGQEETVIDLSVRPGMMNGVFGNIMGGGGHDIQTSIKDGDARWQGAAMVGRFTDKSQLSVILNANNTNNRGFNDMAGNMMGNMRGGGGGMGRGGGGWGRGNGITTSWMGGLNGAFDLFDDKMELGANYLYNGTNRSVLEKSNKITYLDGGDRLVYSNGGDDFFGNDSGYGHSINNSQGHRFGMRLEHKFSDNTSILFQPQVNFGTGNYSEYSRFTTDRESANGGLSRTNDGWENTAGVNKNWTTSGFLLFRQKLGKVGRTVSLMSHYSFSGNKLNGLNQSLTNNYLDGGTSADRVNQFIDRVSNNQSINGRLVYTEPLAEKLFLELHYSYNWANSESIKDAYNIPEAGSKIAFPSNSAFWGDPATIGTKDETYSNTITNVNKSHDAGVTLQYQTEKMRLQAGAAFIPTKTENITNGKSYESTVYNWSPQAMFRYEFNDNADIMAFYRGRSSQPSTSQLMPVPDNSDPLNISFGNPYLLPYFSHNLRSRFGYSNKKTFFSIRGGLSAGLVQNPITSATWYGANGATYNMPMNGPSSGNVDLDFFLNAPIGQSGFSISNMMRAGYNRSASYIGKEGFDYTKYYNAETANFDYELFHKDFGEREDLLNAFTENVISTFNVMERLQAKYSNEAIEIAASGRTRYNRSVYTVSDGVNTWSNQIRGEVTWTVGAGFGLNTRMSYNWYEGYTTPQEDEYVWDAEITKLLFKNKCTLALKAYDILNQSKNLSITDAANYHQEMRNNTLGRYIILSLTFRFGTMERGMGGHGPGMGGHGPDMGGMRGPGGPR